MLIGEYSLDNSLTSMIIKKTTRDELSIFRNYTLFIKTFNDSLDYLILFHKLCPENIAEEIDAQIKPIFKKKHEQHTLKKLKENEETDYTKRLLECP